jgi:hypothetical protein
MLHARHAAVLGSAGTSAFFRGYMDMEPSAPPPPAGRKGSHPDPASPRQGSGPRPHLPRLHEPACALLLALTFSLSACAMEHQTQFDSDAWKSQRGAAATDNRRGSMLPAMEKVLHTGMTRDQVVALLGEPDISNTRTGTDEYELGLAGYGVDEEYYEIRYRDGKLESHRMGRR